MILLIALAISIFLMLPYLFLAIFDFSGCSLRKKVNSIPRIYDFKGHKVLILGKRGGRAAALNHIVHSNSRGALNLSYLYIACNVLDWFSQLTLSHQYLGVVSTVLINRRDYI